MNKPLDLDAPFFTAGQLAGAAGLPRGTADVWVHRGLIGSRGRRTGKGRAPFSIAVVFEAKVFRILAEDVGIKPSESLAIAKQLATVKAEDGYWMFSVARGIENAKPLDLVAALSRSDGRWRSVLHHSTQSASADFGAEKAYIELPISKIFEGVYDTCKRMLAGAVEPAKRKGRQRARP